MRIFSAEVLMRIAIVGILAALTAAAQTPVAPSPDAAGASNGENVGNYNIVDNFELGYRFSSAGGNIEQYESSVNFGNGIRLLGSSLTVNSKDGHGTLFDQIVLTTQGLGNDPYESVIFRIEKNRLYRFDMSWRENAYFNPGLVTAGGNGQHLLDTESRMQDYDLTLFPQSKFKAFLGASFNTQTGPGYSSIQLFDDTGGSFPLFSDVHRVWREYRLGGEYEFAGIRLNVMHGWEDYKDDTNEALSPAGVPGATVIGLVPGTSLSQFQATEPTHGTNPFWRVALFANRKLFNINGRFTYSGGRDAFVVDQSAQGIAASLARIQNIFTTGTGDRPVATGNVNLNFTPTSKLTVSNSTAVYNIRTLGDSFYSQFDTTTQTTTVLFYNFLGIRTVANDTALNYQVSPLWGVMAAYHYSDRTIHADDQFSATGASSTTLEEQSNHLNSGEFGIHVRPLKALTALVSAEVGTNSQPFTPIAQRDFHALNARLQYRKKTYSLLASANTSYNVNDVSFSSFASQSRTYSVSGNWTPRDWLTFDGGFTRIHQYTIGGIAYFANDALIQGESSIYLSNVNSIYAGVRYEIRRRVDLYLGYTRVQDLGDGRSTPTGSAIGSALPAFEAVQTFPVDYQSPVVRISVILREKLRWNAGYQYYGYRENFASTLNFRANTGYTSLSFSF
jgi:hypothetical protein